MKTSKALFYIPDHIRLQRTDRLWHIRDSHNLKFKRFLSAAWNERAAYETCQSLRAEIALIDQELHRRWMLLPARQRIGAVQETTQRYTASRR